MQAEQNNKSRFRISRIVGVRCFVFISVVGGLLFVQLFVRGIRNFSRSGVTAVNIVANDVPPNGTPGNVEPEELIWDAGSVFVGQEVTGRFTFSNDTSENLEVKTDRDIIPDCGCAGVKPEARCVAPGSSTTVVVTVRIQQGAGKFSHGGSIKWTNASGKGRPTRFQVKGAAKQVVEVDPPALHFSNTEIHDAIEKNLVITGAISLDWDNLRIGCQSPYVFIGPARRERDRTVVVVRLRPPDGVEMFTETLYVTGVVCDPKSPLHKQTVGAKVPVEGSQVVRFSVSPSMLLVGHSSKGAIARVIVYGKRVTERDFAIRTISTDHGPIGWTISQPSGSGRAMIELRFEPFDEKKNKPSFVLIEVDDLNFVRIPICWTQDSSKD